MVIRIALQCNEADAYLIMDDNNPAPRLLSRPGEGIYNDMAGTIEGNSPFQVVWLPDEVRETYLAKVRARADQRSPKSEVKVQSRRRRRATLSGPDCVRGQRAGGRARRTRCAARCWSAKSLKPPRPARIWLGAPNSIKGPTEAVFQRQSGNNLLVVGQRDEATLAMVSLGLVSLAAQYPAGAARFILCDGTAPGTPQREFLERVVQAIPHPVTLAKPGDLPKS